MRTGIAITLCLFVFKKLFVCGGKPAEKKKVGVSRVFDGVGWRRDERNATIVRPEVEAT